MYPAERQVERLQAALSEIARLRLATGEGTLAKRADRMWEIACEMLGRPVPGAPPFPSNLRPDMYSTTEKLA